MTAFQKADLPDDIDSVEKVLAWSASVLNNLYFDTTIIENIGSATRVAQGAPFEITASDPIQWRYITRNSLPLSNNWQYQSKVYKQVQPLGSAAIPNDFKV